MQKPFFEVFPTLSVKEELKSLLLGTEITKISANRSKTSLRIYLLGTRLIHKTEIFTLEHEIASQLFPKQHMEVKIIEKYRLSGQYTAKKLMDIYKDSIAAELRAYSLLLYNVYHSAERAFLDETRMRLVLEDTIIARERADELVHILEKIFCERCGMDFIAELSYAPSSGGSHIEKADRMIKQEILNVIRLSGMAGRENASAGASDTPRPERAMKTKEPAARKEAGGRGASYTVKRSGNPDVIYGRDFEDEPITIDKIVGEMGEVVIRGQVIELDTREIRNEKTIVILTVTDFTDTIVLKIFVRNEALSDLLEHMKKGSFLKIKGVTTIDKFDSELTIGSIIGIKKAQDFRGARMDNSPLKRVELHCHTKMSDMDGVSDVKDIIKRAMKWGHKA